MTEIVPLLLLLAFAVLLRIRPPAPIGSRGIGAPLATLAELRERPPAAVVFWRRPASEYDRGLFGEDYGASIRAWIEECYDFQPFRASGTPARVYPRFAVAWRR